MCSMLVGLLATYQASYVLQQQDLLRMEHVLLNELEWRSQAPTTYTFISMFSQAMQTLPWDVFNLAAYFGVSSIPPEAAMLLQQCSA